MIMNNPIELAYALANINCDDRYSITPSWVLKNHPKVGNILKLLRNVPCAEGCKYCNEKLDVKLALNSIFGFEKFRTYEGEPLQEMAADAAVKGKSLLAVFPTGGGKSLTFQLPALMAGAQMHGLTVVIVPLKSLEKDQVDNLEEKGITDAVMISGLLSPVERANAIERVADGRANILYISPEQLRSKTIETLLLSRNIARFIIDEAYCFSAWGQDFKVDYLYIGDFINMMQKKKVMQNPIPVSCFTATAKQKVISDICDYFKRKLNLDLEIFTTTATRKNLSYTVLFKETDEEKYNELRDLISSRKCPTIVYVSRTRRTFEIAEKLTGDGFPAKPFNGKMEPSDKIANQEAFIKNEVQVIVATSAFGMGVDKKDVKLVIHYDISDSLENYVQEAGRAGRDEDINAECIILFNNEDLDKHFMLLNQTKLSIGEIQEVWKAIKDLTKSRQDICCSALEIARQAGWDDSKNEIETRVKTAISALETAGYIKRGRNFSKVYATGIRADNMREAAYKIDSSDLFDKNQREIAKRIVKYLISSRSIAEAGNDDAESRVDYIADNLGLEKEVVINSVNAMKEIELLADSQDMSAYFKANETENKTLQILDKFVKLERFILNQLPDEGLSVNLKELNDSASSEGLNSANVKNIKTIINFWRIKGFIEKSEFHNQDRTDLIPKLPISKLEYKLDKRIDICRYIVDVLYQKSLKALKKSDGDKLVEFSLVGLFNSYKQTLTLNIYNEPVTMSDFSDALLYLQKIGAMSLQGGFLVLYNRMEIKRIVTDNKIRYKHEDYRTLSEYYKQKIQQIHIVGEYANLMVKDYNAALQFVNDYFQMDFKKFIATYFKGERAAQIEKNITPEKYNQLVGGLSDIQSAIINDSESKYIVVAAGPGSGKTKILVHKLASLLMLEDVKHEQLLMLTFSRAAATEFKKRLMGLIGNAVHFVEIKTFHSYCFDLLGKLGDAEAFDNVVKDAAQMIYNGDVELGKITKSVLVIDEAQDMDEDEFALVKALVSRNEDMRVIAVGDDDQNIYEFRGASSVYLRSLISDYGARKYEMTENFRSRPNIVALSNWFADKISDRMKSTPNEAIQNDNGIVKLIHYRSENMEEPIVQEIKNRETKSSVCILTNTNDEALRLVGLLTKNGIKAKLIQSMDGFSLQNLVEVRYFLDKINSQKETPLISDKVWMQAKFELKDKFKNSSCLSNLLNLLAEFESVNKIKYYSDFEEFVKGSNYEDFYNDEEDEIIVSTIHKAKGKEFKTVYLMLTNFNSLSDENKRKLYVGMARAKEELYIHYNNELFLNIPVINGVQQEEKGKQYSRPNEITIQLSHRDVFLDYFKYRQEVISKLISGAALTIKDDRFGTIISGNFVEVLKLSKVCSEKINKMKGQGYLLEKALIRFIVYWKGVEDTEGTAIILPELHLKR
ncbi:MAG: RecQ family ATP-dependent DNA helicase [Lachnospiraceae bacterium]|nr:RecQ family ATP-dependent DNA helicase [Lachnospiraceae bacterium]